MELLMEKVKWLLGCVGPPRKLRIYPALKSKLLKIDRSDKCTHQKKISLGMRIEVRFGMLVPSISLTDYSTILKP